MGAYGSSGGHFKGELDPQDPRNRVIVNLDKAPRNDSGKVEYEADFSILRPANPALGNHKLIYDVTNRGRKNLYRRFMDTKTRSDPRNAEDVVNASILRMGYTFAWSGWEPDAPRTDGGLAMKPVVATNGGAAYREDDSRRIRERHAQPRGSLRQPGPGPQHSSFRLSYEAATRDPARAKLSVRRNESDERREIPASGWAYVNAREIELLPRGTKPETGSLYEFHYPATNPIVLGAGMAAVRDLVSFLRHETSREKGDGESGGHGLQECARIWLFAKRSLSA